MASKLVLLAIASACLIQTATGSGSDALTRRLMQELEITGKYNAKYVPGHPVEATTGLRVRPSEALQKARIDKAAADAKAKMERQNAPHPLCHFKQIAERFHIKCDGSKHAVTSFGRTEDAPEFRNSTSLPDISSSPSNATNATSPSSVPVYAPPSPIRSTNSRFAPVPGPARTEYGILG